MPGPLINSRYEIVAQERANGASQENAVLAAGMSKGSRNRVCRKPEVLARVLELQRLRGMPVHPAAKMRVRSSPGKRLRPYTQNDVISQVMEVAMACRTDGNFREANSALKHASVLIAERDGLRPKPKPTKKQREQRQRNEPDPQGDLNDDPPAHAGGTPDISEIADVVGRLNDGPGDLTQEEADRTVAGGSEGSVHEIDRNG